MSVYERGVPFGVFLEQGKRGPKFRAYSMWYSPTWDGFYGRFVGSGATRRDAMGDAIAQARHKYEAERPAGDRT